MELTPQISQRIEDMVLVYHPIYETGKFRHCLADKQRIWAARIYMKAVMRRKILVAGNEIEVEQIFTIYKP